MNKITPLISMCMAALIAAGTTARADTEFSFQGELKDNGGLATGSFNLDVTLWDALVGGNQIGSPLVLNGVPVTEGRFAVELDFGSAAFDNSGRWLEIAVEGFTLSPRHPITRSPYSIQTRGIYVDANEKVGIGTTAPAVTLHVEGPILSGGQNGGDIGARNPNNETAGVGLGWGNDLPRIRIGGDGTGTDSGFDIQTVGNRSLMRILNSGDVGIGTTEPMANLHIDGSGSNAIGFHIDAPGSSTGSLQIGSPAGDVGIAGFANNGHRRDIRFSDGGLGLYTRNSSSQPTSGNGLFINEFGDVGIGTTNPTESLDVVGAVIADRFKLEFAGSSHTQIDANSTATTFGNYAGGDIELRTGTTPPFAATRLIVKNNGKVGIVTLDPDYTLHVDGSAGKPGGGSWSNSSDRRLKKNIEPLEDALGQLLQLRGVTFEYIDPQAIHELPGERIGMVAQEVEQIVPDWVETREDGYLTVTYRGFEALTVEAFRELRDENDTLRTRLDSVEALVKKIAKPDFP